MEKRLLQFLFLILFSPVHGSSAQNLVPNYSFEVIDTCPYSSGQIYYAQPWISPTIYGSPDLFSCSYPFGEWNWAGSQQAKDGESYASLFLYIHTPGSSIQYNAREYLQVKLSEPLLKDECYRLRFFVSLADGLACYKATTFSAFFSDTAVSDTALWSFNSVMEYVPQFHFSDPAGIGDTSSWYKIEGTYSAAGGEQYMTIGNFSDDAHTVAVLYDMTASPAGTAYYYIDSISLVPEYCIHGELEKPGTPIIFSPNNDGVNDVFFLHDASESSHLQIFDRWGTLVFQSDGRTDWDGSRAGAGCTEGVYFFLLTESGGGARKGFLHLVR